jgi:hypothetical protein
MILLYRRIVQRRRAWVRIELLTGVCVEVPWDTLLAYTLYRPLLVRPPHLQVGVASSAAIQRYRYYQCAQPTAVRAVVEGRYTQVPRYKTVQCRTVPLALC